MNELIDISLSFPTVVFTTGSLIAIGYWLVSASLGFVDGFAEAEVDLDADLEPGFDLDSDGDGLGLGSLVNVLGLHLVPTSVALTVLSLTAWLTSVVSVVVLDSDDQRLGAMAAVVAFVIAIVVGTVVAGRVARALAPVFVAQRAERHRDLIGRICTVQTGRVDDGFGQGTIRTAKGDEHVVQIRCAVSNQLKAGDPALVVDVDDGTFVVSPDVAGLT